MKQEVLCQFPRIETASERADLIAEYRRIREVGTAVNHRLVGRLPKGVLEEGGEKLGLFTKRMFTKKRFVFSEEQMPVLMDYCIHHIERDGKNTVDQLLLDSPPKEGTDEWTYIRALERSIYSLFRLESIVPATGAIAKNLISDRLHLITDLGLAATSVPGVVIATRLLNLEDFSMTGGAPLSVTGATDESHEPVLKKMLAELAHDEEGLTDPASLIRVVLERNSSGHVRYQNPGASPNSEFRPMPAPKHKVGRNSPCPCGSGKKYKQCCLRKARR